MYVQYARASPSKPCSIEIELTRRKTQDSCRVSLSSNTPQDTYKVAGGALRAPLAEHSRWTTSVVDLQGCCDLFHKTDNQSPITVRKITIGGDVKVKGVWTSQKEFTDCPVDMRLKTRTPVEFLRFPEKDECDEEPVVVEEPTPKRAPPPYAPKVLGTLRCARHYSAASATLERWPGPRPRGASTLLEGPWRPSTLVLDLPSPSLSNERDLYGEVPHRGYYISRFQSITSSRRPNQKMKNAASPSGSRDRGRMNL